jgi:hypothetical protein
MNTISINGKIEGKNIAIGQNATINECMTMNNMNERDNCRDETLAQLVKVEEMLTKYKDQLDNSNALKQDILAIKQEINKKSIDTNSISIKLFQLESSVKSIASIVAALNAIKVILGIN